MSFARDSGDEAEVGFADERDLRADERDRIADLREAAADARESVRTYASASLTNVNGRLTSEHEFSPLTSSTTFAATRNRWTGWQKPWPVQVRLQRSLAAVTEPRPSNRRSSARQAHRIDPTETRGDAARRRIPYAPSIKCPCPWAVTPAPDRLDWWGGARSARLRMHVPPSLPSTRAHSRCYSGSWDQVPERSDPCRCLPNTAPPTSYKQNLDGVTESGTSRTLG